MTAITRQLDAMESAHWVPEPPEWKKIPFNLGMRAAGRIGAILNGALGSRAGSKLGILTYHRIAPHVKGLPAPLHNVEPDRFREQFETLIKRGFQFIPLNRALSAAQRGEPLPAKSVVVTFDDGFGTVYTRAFPILEQLNIPATVFINTAYLDSDEPFPFDAWGVGQQNRAPVETYRPLRTEECFAMAASGLVQIGAHTHTHKDHRGKVADFHADLLQSVEIVRDQFGEEEVPFAFPYGSVHRGFADEKAVDAAKRTGVSCGLTTTADLVDLTSSPFCWGRFNAFEWDTGTTLAAKFGGWYGWAPRARQLLARAVRARRGSYIFGSLSNILLLEVPLL